MQGQNCNNFGHFIGTCMFKSVFILDHVSALIFSTYSILVSRNKATSLALNGVVWSCLVNLLSESTCNYHGGEDKKIEKIVWICI